MTQHRLFQSDPIFEKRVGLPDNIATSVLIAAGTPGGALGVEMVEARDLLECVGFDGTGPYLTAKNRRTDCGDSTVRDREEALDLAATLDQYNNGDLCGDP